MLDRQVPVFVQEFNLRVLGEGFRVLRDFAPLGSHCGSMRFVVCGVGGWDLRCFHLVGRDACVRTSELRF